MSVLGLSGLKPRPAFVFKADGASNDDWRPDAPASAGFGVRVYVDEARMAVRARA